jgi:hypothetical protein
MLVASQAEGGLLRVLTGGGVADHRRSQNSVRREERVRAIASGESASESVNAATIQVFSPASGC